MEMRIRGRGAGGDFYCEPIEGYAEMDRVEFCFDGGLRGRMCVCVR